MNRRRFVKGYRWVFGPLALIAMAANFEHSVVGDGFDPVSFFSYFTIISNLFAAALLPYGAWPGTAPHDLLRGAATVYMAITGLVYGLLLASYPVAIPAWINTVEHRIMPVVIVLDWVLDPPRRRIPYRRAALWLAFPIVYLCYTELRGPLADWYPYPFLDPRIGGYGRVAAYVLGITAAFVAVTIAVAAAANRLTPADTTETKDRSGTRTAQL